MVIIGAMIGTDDLEQLVLKSLSDKHGIGNGLIRGLYWFGVKRPWLLWEIQH